MTGSVDMSNINEKKIEILQKNFSILIEKFSEDSNAVDGIEKILTQMISLDVILFIEMWRYLLDRYEDLLSDTDEYRIVKMISGDFIDWDNFKEFIDILKKEDDILEKIAGLSAYPPVRVFTNILNLEYDAGLPFIGKVITLQAENINNKTFESGRHSFDEFMDDLSSNLWYLDKNKEIRQPVIDLLVIYIDKITDETVKAKIEVSLVEYM